MPLTDLSCRSAKPSPSQRKMFDGGGLYLLVRSSRSKLWQMAYRFEGKTKTLSFGAYPKVSLAEARGLRDRAKTTLAGGRDPSKGIEAATGDTFKDVATEWFKINSAQWKFSYSGRLWSRIEDDLISELGDKLVAEVGAPEMLTALRKIEQRGALDIAKRMRGILSQVFRFAVATSRAERDPAADLVDALKKRPKAVHHKALTTDDLPEFFKRLALYGDKRTSAAIQLVMHTFVRTGEIRFATWSEIDGDLWRIPGERMKMGRDHLIPLTTQSLALLAELKSYAGESKWVVPSELTKRPISENTMLFALYSMGYKGVATIHGMRGLASTVLNESGLWSPDAIERQLAHVPSDKVRSAYNAAQYMPERRRMMEWWSERISK